MEFLSTLLILAFLYFFVLFVVDFFWLIIKRRRVVGPLTSAYLDITAVIILPNVFLAIQGDNDCCSSSSAFSPDHRLSIWLLVIVCGLVYIFTRNRKSTAPPLTELLINIILVIGIVLDLFVIYHQDAFWLLGLLPVLYLFLIRLIASHRLLQLEIAQGLIYNGIWESNAYYLLRLKAWQKYPLMLVLCLPVLVLLASILLLFGQQPDSIVKAFTETYKHGFSQLDYQCDNVECGGHYLCSVAAQGHRNIVKPIRYGHRNGGVIICNRQLLISNAFEEMILERFPRSHRVVRRNYDKIGDVVKSHYHLFSIKWISDLVYILMKPLEWIFLISLYLFIRNPESKIAQQYLIKH